MALILASPHPGRRRPVAITAVPRRRPLTPVGRPASPDRHGRSCRKARLRLGGQGHQYVEKERVAHRVICDSHMVFRQGPAPLGVRTIRRRCSPEPDDPRSTRRRIIRPRESLFPRRIGALIQAYAAAVSTELIALSASAAGESDHPVSPASPSLAGLSESISEQPPWLQATTQ